MNDSRFQRTLRNDLAPPRLKPNEEAGRFSPGQQTLQLAISENFVPSGGAALETLARLLVRWAAAEYAEAAESPVTESRR